MPSALPYPANAPQGWELSLGAAKRDDSSLPGETIVTVGNLLDSPSIAIETATLQKFAKITPQYPGIRAPLPGDVCSLWLAQLGPALNEWFGPARRWEMHAWFSLVTAAPHQLLPIQRLPHVDGTDPAQIAMMLYLHRTQHGGTAFFRHRSTGLSALTGDTYPLYAAALQREVAAIGLPAPAYVTDGEPLFERIHTAPGVFNQAVFYRGNILHSGVIDNAAPLPADPREGRLTINAFFRPVRQHERSAT